MRSYMTADRKKLPHIQDFLQDRIRKVREEEERRKKARTLRKLASTSTGVDTEQ